MILAKRPGVVEESAIIGWYRYSLGSTDLWRVDCRSNDFKFPSLCSFCVLIHVFRDFESFSLFFGSQHPLSEIVTYFGQNLRFVTHGYRKGLCFFLSIICQRTGLLLKEDMFVSNIPLARTLTVFTSWVASQVTNE